MQNSVSIKSFFKHFSKGRKPDDTFWEWVTLNYSHELTISIQIAGFDTKNFDYAFGKAIVRLNKLIRAKKKKCWGQAFIPFLKQAILDEIIVFDIQTNGGQVAFPYLLETIFPKLKEELDTKKILTTVHLEELKSHTLSQLSQRIKLFSLLHQTATFEDYFMDELIISMIEASDRTQNLAFDYLKKNWFDYIVAKAKFHEKEDLFIVVVSNLFKRITSPKNGEKLVLEHSLKTYLYRCALNELSKGWKKTERQDLDDKTIISGSKQPEIKQNRWERLNVTFLEMQAAIKQLHARCLELFLLEIKDGGLSDQEIASQLDISVRTVQNNRSNCKNQIEEFIQNSRK